MIGTHLFLWAAEKLSDQISKALLASGHVLGSAGPCSGLRVASAVSLWCSLGKELMAGWACKSLRGITGGSQEDKTLSPLLGVWQLSCLLSWPPSSLRLTVVPTTARMSFLKSMCYQVTPLPEAFQWLPICCQNEVQGLPWWSSG